MNLKELNSFKLSDAVTFHDKLNPKLWNGTKLRPDVREQLLVIAQDFLQELGVHDLDVKDITISGSNAAFSYTKHSDLDLHILVDMGNLPVDEVYRELFTAKKTIYNDTHDIKINNIPVELYVQDSRQPVVSLGEYSVMNDQWIKIPTKRRSDFDQTATKSKYEKLLSLIEIALKSKKYSKVKHIIDTIKRYRQSGLDKGGEFGPENLAYKMLRSQGYITKLYELRDKLHSEKLSFETMYRNVTDEDYDPNGPPPGPETKPTMPRGTVRVDVSDVYDWYKLGQNISNLDRVDPKIFGKGPPSTIVSFGDENTEHKYINALKNLGLGTTDIDPVDPNQPKSMPRQKVDPTYNVNEAFDQPYSLQWEVGEFGDYDAYTKLPDGSNLSIMFNNDGVDDNAYSIEFWRNNSQEATGEGDGQRIFATVLHAIQEFLTKEQPNFISFIGAKDETGEGKNSRVSLYSKLLQRYATKWGYKLKNLLDSNDSVEFDLVKIKQKAVGENYTMQFAAEKTPPVSPYAGVKDNQYRGGISESADKKISFKVQKGKGKFSTTLTVNNSPAGIYQYDSNTGRSIAEVYPEFKGKGLGKLLVLHAIYTAAQLGLDFQEDESRTAAYDNVLDSLSSNGYIVDDDGYWYVTGEGEQYLKQSLNEASGYIPSEKQKNDPRFKTALTVDVHPDSIKKNAKAFYWNTSRAGIPPTAKVNGKI